MEKCKTLGDETHFEFTYNEGDLTIQYGTQNTQVVVDKSIITQVINRVSYLKENNIENSRTVGYYSLTHWEECPNTVQCPYVAKLVLDVFPKEIIEAYLS